MWLESHAELRDHPKLDLLTDLLAITRRDAVGLLHFVWWRALMYAPSGDLADYTDGQIARWADWDGDPGHLVSALRTAGFVDAQRTLHDWDDYAGRWIERREANAERKRVARAAAKRGNGTSGAGPPDDRRMSRQSPALPDRTGPDLTLTGPDLTSPPLPPSPQAGKGERRSRRRGSSGDQGEDTTAPPPEVLAPPTPEDQALWQLALGKLPPMTEHNRAQVSQLEPLGRAPDGGLRLRAPPGLFWAQRFKVQVARALFEAGDERAKLSAIVEW